MLASRSFFRRALERARRRLFLMAVFCFGDLPSVANESVNLLNGVWRLISSLIPVRLSAGTENSKTAIRMRTECRFIIGYAVGV